MDTTLDVRPPCSGHIDQKGITVMCVRAISGSLKIAGMVSIVLLILAPPAAEAKTRNIQSFTLAERQLLLIERMTNSALLAILEVDASPRLQSIHWSRDRFAKMQTNLLKGNPHLGLRPTTEPKILETLDKTELQWRRYNSVFEKIVKSGTVSETQISILAERHANTIEALRQTVQSYRYFVNGGQHHSILSSTINGTGRLRASAQLVLRKLMMAAHNKYAKEERQKLADSTREFDETINGLIDGDPGRGLVAAATHEIKRELLKVRVMWNNVRPILDAAASGHPVSKDRIAIVARSADDMAVTLTIALIMYLNV